MASKLTDAQILEKVIHELHLNNNSFGLKLGYSQSTIIYNVLKGKKSLSSFMKIKIITTFPEVNIEFLEKGTGEVLLKRLSEIQAAKNILKTPFEHNIEERLNRIDAQQKMILSKLNLILGKNEIKENPSE